MNPKDLKRLAALMAKSNLSDAEKAELTELQKKAAAAGEAGDELTPEDLTEIVTKAVAGNKGITADEVKAIVADALKAVPTGANKDDVKSIVADAVAGKTVSKSDVEEIVVKALKGIRQESKMSHDDEADAIETPISHRLGNLTVGQKQLLNVMVGKGMNEGIDAEVLKKAEARGERAEKRLVNGLRSKAITSTGAGTGLEIMNVTIGSQIQQRLYMESALAARLVSQEIQMPSDPYKLPISTTRPKFRSGVAQLAAPTGSEPGTSGLTLTSSKLVGLVEYSYEADEDALVAILPWATEQLSKSAAESLERALVAGDTAGTQDNGGAAGDDIRIFDGIRKLTLAQAALKVNLATGGISLGNIGLMKKALGKWGLNPKDLLLIAGPAGYNDLTLLPETLTAEKVGNASMARALTGMAPNILGIDIIPSAAVREDTDSTGVVSATGANNTKGTLHLIHVPSWILGVRRGFLLETDVDKKAQSKAVIASFRRAFTPVESLANIRAAVTGYNYTSGA